MNGCFVHGALNMDQTVKNLAWLAQTFYTQNITVISLLKSTEAMKVLNTIFQAYSKALKVPFQ